MTASQMLKKMLSHVAAAILVSGASSVGAQVPDNKATDYLKVEVRGTLAIQGTVESDLKVLRNSYRMNTSGVSITSGRTRAEVYVSDDLRQLVREHNGKRVVLTGTLLFLDPPVGYQRLTTIPLMPRTLIQVTGIKAADAEAGR
jgi:hypothetical protein